MKWKGIALALWAAVGIMAISSCETSSTKETDSKPAKKKGSQKLMGQVRVGDAELYVTLKSKDEEIQASNFIVSTLDGKKNVAVHSVKTEKKGKYAYVITDKLDSGKNYNIGVISYDERAEKLKTNYYELQWGDKLLDQFYSDKQMGATLTKDSVTFRLFAPRATKVTLSVFTEAYKDAPGKEKQNGESQYTMQKDADGVWEYTLKGNNEGKLYGYRVFGPKGATEDFHPEYIIADPYSKATATLQVAPQSQLSVLIDTSRYQWSGTKTYMGLKMRDMIVYESHVRDLTMLSPNVTKSKKGTYEGLVEDNKIGGIAHVKELGVNAIELLPTQDFNEIEAPYRVKSDDHVFNTWNTYGRNHWGYMTSGFFAPEAFYAVGKFQKGEWIGTSGSQVFQFKKMVDEFHKNGIAVIMDVVYNHISQYDRNPYKYIDKKYYFYLTAGGAYESKSGCGNDFNTQRKMTKKMIVDSTLYWIKEYHIDGYRFDLATMIDRSIFKESLAKAKLINPDALYIAEPWAMSTWTDNPSYDPGGFDRDGMGAWNDKTRNFVKGSNNASWGSKSGLVMGNANLTEWKKAITGNPEVFKNNVGNSIHFIEAHDNSTLSDVIRYANKSLGDKKDYMITLKNYVQMATLDELQMKQNKIAALTLLTLQGSIMIHEGQEFARMKAVIPPSGDSIFPPGSDSWSLVEGKWKSKNGNDWSSKAEPGKSDHDSYEKDNENNWLNWDLKQANIDLFNYYKGLIALRKANKGFTTMDIEKVTFINAMTKDAEPKTVKKNAFGWVYDKAYSKDSKSWIILVNSDQADTYSFTLPEGEWKVAVDGKSSIKPAAQTFKDSVDVAPITGYVLYK